MNPLFEKYLNISQYNKIRKYWRIIEKLKFNIHNFDITQYSFYDEYSDDDDTIIECFTHNKIIDYNYQQLLLKLDYFEHEYYLYIHKIGYTFNDQSYDEHLFNLLNNGILL